MKIGDLVELSAAGEKSSYYKYYTGLCGIVLRHHRNRWVVQWFNQDGTLPPYRPFIERCYLKHRKKKKLLDKTLNL